MGDCCDLKRMGGEVPASGAFHRAEPRFHALYPAAPENASPYSPVFPSLAERDVYRRCGR